MTKLLLTRGLLKPPITTVPRPFIFFGASYVINELWMNVFKLGDKLPAITVLIGFALFMGLFYR